MRTNTRFRLVHARKGEEGKSLLQLEIRFVSGQRKFISTGIYLEPAQWDGTIIKNTDCDAILNKQAQDKITLLRNEEIKQGRSLVPSQVDRLLQGPKSSSTSFLKFARGQINNRKGLADGTIFTHNRAINYLEECFGKFDFEDFTSDNVK